MTERHERDNDELGKNAPHQRAERCPGIIVPIAIGHMYADGNLGRLEHQRIDVCRLLDDDCPNGCTYENKYTGNEGGYGG